jgi:hypothetical protein
VPFGRRFLAVKTLRSIGLFPAKPDVRFRFKGQMARPVCCEADQCLLRVSLAATPA